MITRPARPMTVAKINAGMTMNKRTAAYPPLAVELRGEYACFTRPELKTERVSYPVMTPSAAKGVLESIYWKPEFEYLLTSIEVLKPIQWVTIRRNEVTEMVTAEWVRAAMQDPGMRYDAEGDRDQRSTVFLRDVAYRIRAQVRPKPHAGHPEAAYREQFRRRVDKGACFSHPFLGTRECSAEFGKDTGAEPHKHTEDLGIMLHSILYTPQGERYTWFQARLEQGVLLVPETGLEVATSRRDS
jgi:CRISPR-associated protein Cas5d